MHELVTSLTWTRYVRTVHRKKHQDTKEVAEYDDGYMWNMHILFLILLAIVVENSVVASTGAKKYLREYFSG